MQARLDLIFATFLRVGSASKVLRALNERGLSIPRRGRFGDTVWRSADRSRHPGGAEEPGLCGGVRLRTQPFGWFCQGSRQQVSPVLG